MSWPTIDLSQPARLVAEAIDQACCDVGFFALVGHGVTHATIDNMWTATERFFDLDTPTKLAAQHRDPTHPYGYFPAGREALAASLGVETPPDLKESFNLAPPQHHVDGTGRFGGVERIWPSLDGFEEAWSTYYDAMTELADRVLAHFADALNVDPAIFAATCTQHLSALRGLNYPPLTTGPQALQLRAGAHSDYGTLTILLPGPGTGGLEVLHRSDGWTTVDPVPGAFVVNIGDMMQQWTNDRWLSTTHRVVVPNSAVAASERRQAVAFFHQPNWDATIDVLPSCVSSSYPKKYDAVQAGPWLLTKFDAASNGASS